MESTGKAGMIQISSSTADLLIEAGKRHWLKEREDKVNAKGKGELTTFWLLPLRGRKHDRRSESTHTLSDSVSVGEEIVTSTSDIKNSNLKRIVTWVVDGLSPLLKNIARQRIPLQQEQQHVPYDKTLQSLESELIHNGNKPSLHRVTNEVKEVIDFSGLVYDATCCHDDTSHSDESTSFDEDVIHQLSQYIHVIATTYQSNAFHNFDHASHVTMSVMKMLSRIVQPKLKITTISSTSSEQTMNDRICQIVSDPLTRFACIFSAIIHDCDHYGKSQQPFCKRMCYSNHMK
jgi:3'5'-cyclic nucleotide phosphodiesterase